MHELIIFLKASHKYAFQRKIQIVILCAPQLINIMLEKYSYKEPP